MGVGIPLGKKNKNKEALAFSTKSSSTTILTLHAQILQI